MNKYLIAIILLASSPVLSSSQSSELDITADIIKENIQLKQENNKLKKEKEELTKLIESLSLPKGKPLSAYPGREIDW